MLLIFIHKGLHEILTNVRYVVLVCMQWKNCIYIYFQDIASLPPTCWSASKRCRSLLWR